MRCPLCSGPVLDEGPTQLRAIGHSVEFADTGRSMDARLAEALWMAIEALDSEAEVLRMVNASDDAPGMAAEAERQAQLLRDFAKRHASPVDH